MNKPEVIEQARERFKRCEDWESMPRSLFQQDMRFEAADADNGYQWDDNTRKQRALKRKPSLTINKTRQYCLQIINDMRKNKSQIRVVPVSDDASKEAADVFEGLIRHTEYISDAQSVYISAVEPQVKAGIGYWRVCTDYKNNRSNDQEIYLKRIRNPLTVYLDPDIAEFDGSDARFGFVFDDMARDLAEKKYSRYKDHMGQAPLNNSDGWNQKDTVRIAEYYRKREKRDTLIFDRDGQVHLKSELAAEIVEGLLADDRTKTREVIDPVIDWFLIIGDTVVESTIWPGKYIPIVRVIGEENVVDGVLDRKGHVRALKDPQRMYNYWASAATEQIALQTKTPWIAPMKSIEGVEEIWKNSAINEPAVLPWRHVDDSGAPIPPPQRIEPPSIAQAYMAGLEVSEQQMQMVSGQYQAMMGEPSNEKSGRAINARQRQGDNATYHYIDNFATALRFTGKILIDLYPKIYDTKRVQQILAENGDRQTITIDPNAPDGHQQQGEDDGAEIIFNPNVGEYSVESGVGPDYATKRQEAFQAFIDIAQASPEIMQKAGDLMFKAADFPMAEDIAERLKPGPSPELQAATQGLQKAQELISKLMGDLADKKREIDEGAAKHEIEQFKADTDRMNAVSKIEPDALRPVIHAMVHAMMEDTLPNLLARYQIAPQQAEEQQEPTNE